MRADQKVDQKVWRQKADVEYLSYFKKKQGGNYQEYMNWSYLLSKILNPFFYL